MKARNLVHMLNETVKRLPNQTALMWKENGSYLQMSYKQYWDEIRYAAYGLSHFGVVEDTKVALISNSNQMWGISDFAIASLGAVSVPVYPTLPSEQVVYILNNADVDFAIVENEEQLQKVINHEHLKKIIVMRPDENFKETERVVSFPTLTLTGKQFELTSWEQRWQAYDRNKLLTIIHTSGTTGNPKGVMLTHGNFLANIKGIQFWIFNLHENDVFLSYLPLSHILERLAGHYYQFSVGTTVAYAESIDTLLDDIKKIKPTVMTSVPRLFEKIYATIKEGINSGPAFKKKLFNWALSVGLEKYEHYLNTPIDDQLFKNTIPPSLQRKLKIADRLVFQKIKKVLGGRIRGMVSGGATLNAEVSKFFWALGIPIYEGYGLTETSPVIAINPIIRAKSGTVGKILPNIEVRIAEDGEVLVRGPSVMKGYYNDKEETDKAFIDDWFLTGDIGSIDSDNCLKIIDRKKRILVLSTGKNVAPQPIESKINESAYIQHSVILGDNEKFISVLVNPDFENLLTWAKQRGIKSTSYKEVCNHPDVQQLFKKEIERLTKAFADFEQPKKIVVIDEEWTVDGGELTPKLSLRLNVIEEKYKETIAAVYYEDESDHEDQLALVN